MANDNTLIAYNLYKLRNEFHTLTLRPADLWTWKHVEYYLDNLADYFKNNPSSTSVTQIVAGTGITISPIDGTGVVTINATGGGVDSIIAGSNISISPAGGTGDVTINAVIPTPSFIGYGAFFSDQSQPIVSINTPQIVTINNTYEAESVSIISNRITFANAGTYQFSFTAAVFNSANSVQNCDFWIKYNGVDFPNSGIMMTLNQRKNSSEPSEQQMSLTLTGTAQNDGDYIELYWQGTSTSLELGYVASGPGTAPVNSPSVIANIIPVKGI